MPRAQAKELKVTLNPSNSEKVRKAAKKYITTPPKLVNHIIENMTITGLNYSRK